MYLLVSLLSSLRLHEGYDYMHYLGLALMLLAFVVWSKESTVWARLLPPARAGSGRTMHTISPSAAAVLTAIAGAFLLVSGLTGDF
jgi:hypothetical protein